jgi:hypothetical protein
MKLMQLPLSLAAAQALWGDCEQVFQLMHGEVSKQGDDEAIVISMELTTVCLRECVVQK